MSLVSKASKIRSANFTSRLKAKVASLVDALTLTPAAVAA